MIVGSWVIIEKNAVDKIAAIYIFENNWITFRVPLNWNVVLMKDGIKQMINNLPP